MNENKSLRNNDNRSSVSSFSDYYERNKRNSDKKYESMVLFRFNFKRKKVFPFIHLNLKSFS
jgi:hypothetical protein